ncbi:HlyD family secretion protein [Neotabrizicola sp. sgz301269]|uniref:HlyD family secretion protein n=1 Tax=Neotabrizicola sp. sgz301269 TaxID=3276282 RepID=UPI00376FA5FF
MRYTRLFLGFVVIVLALWVISYEQMTGASADAVVNARLSTLRAPIAGTVALPPRTLGASVHVDQELGTITDPLVDTLRLNDLVMERGVAAAELARLDQELVESDAGIEAQKAREESYRARRIAEIETRLSHAKARLALLEQTSGTGGGSAAALLDEGQSGSQGDPQVDGIALDYARERVDVLEITLEAARTGVFLGDGYNDAPYAEQRRNELATLRAGLVAERDMATARLKLVEDRLSQERVRVALLSSGAIKATAGGQVWEILASNGESVQRGQDVLRLLNCDSALVTLSVTQSTYNDLRVGQEAVFHLDGDGRNFAGSVIRLAGSGASTIYRNLAIAPSEKHLQRYDVAVLVPALRELPELRCAVGRTGRVFFDRRPLDWLRDFWR